MDRHEAIYDIQSSSITVRLKAARYFSKNATPDDFTLLMNILDSEQVAQIQFVLREALYRIVGDKPNSVCITDNVKDTFDVSENIAIEFVTHSLLHELSPLVGRLDVFAAQEISNFEHSRTNQIIGRIKLELIAFKKLNTAIHFPVVTEFNLDRVIEDVVSSIEVPDNVEVMLAGQAPHIISSDTSLVELVMSNAVRNAVEASVASRGDEKNIVITWGETDIDYWIVVLDKGIGLKPDFFKRFALGSSTKVGHLGYGLRLAVKAARSLNGNITLSERTGGGTKFEFRWSKIIEGAF